MIMEKRETLSNMFFNQILLNLKIIIKSVYIQNFLYIALYIICFFKRIYIYKYKVSHKTL